MTPRRRSGTSRTAAGKPTVAAATPPPSQSRHSRTAWSQGLSLTKQWRRWLSPPWQPRRCGREVLDRNVRRGGPNVRVVYGGADANHPTGQPSRVGRSRGASVGPSGDPQHDVRQPRDRARGPNAPRRSTAKHAVRTPGVGAMPRHAGDAGGHQAPQTVDCAGSILRCG